MKERPIIFSAPMVRAILDGRKTQTRRAVKPQPQGTRFEPETDTLGREFFFCLGEPEAKGRPIIGTITCPHGAPGDRLWVRETWADFCPLWDGAWCGHGNEAGKARDHEVYYAADDEAAWKRGKPSRWRPSIHMPRWASRITLEIVSVRVERVQEISEEDAIAEGIYQEPEDSDSMFAGLWTKGPRSEEGNYHSSPRDAYFDLWDSINAKRAPWESNPWVWVIEFRRVDA